MHARPKFPQLLLLGAAQLDQPAGGGDLDSTLTAGRGRSGCCLLLCYSSLLSACLDSLWHVINVGIFVQSSQGRSSSSSNYLFVGYFYIYFDTPIRTQDTKAMVTFLGLTKRDKQPSKIEEVTTV